MRTLYTVQLEIGIPDDKDANATAATVAESVIKWITDWYQAKKHSVLTLSENCSLIPEDGHTIEIRTEVIPRASVRSFTWTYPHGDNLHWTSSVEIAQFDNAVEFALTISIDSSQFFIAPVQFKLDRPRIVFEVLRKFDCSFGGAHLETVACEKSAVDIPGLVQDRLLNPIRRLPMVVISPDSHTGNYLVLPNGVAAKLAGIAEVYRFKDKWASSAFTESIGKQFSCYNGAVRTYWPLGRETLHAYSPIQLPYQIRTTGGTTLEETLLKDFSAISSFRFIQGPVSADAKDLITEVKAAEQVSLRKAAQEVGDYQALAASYESEAVDLRKDVGLLRLENSRMISQIQDLGEQLRINQENLKVAFIGKPALEESPILEEAEAATTVSEAVSFAEQEFSSTLEFTKNAHKSALITPYRHPERVAEALEAMDAVCKEWRSSKENRTSVGSFEELFQEYGFTYKSRESPTTVGRWPEEYEMLYKGEKVSIQPHLALGKGGPESCLRIQFHIDENLSRLVIDHVGRHKTNLST